MKSNLKRLGNYIELYDEINDSMEFNDLSFLQGIANSKNFQECKSNKNDIDIYRYRICRNNMFAYNKATSRNGEKISIAYRTTGDCLVSPSYICFYITKKDKLLPEYLMLIFQRPEFDRLARFNSWGSATEFLSWEDFCELKVLIPDFKTQQEIVTKYKTLLRRLEINNNINSKIQEILKLKLQEYKLLISNSSELEYLKIRTLVDSNIENLSKKDTFKTIEYLDTGSIKDNQITDIQSLNILTDEIPSRCKRKILNEDIVFSTVRPNLKHYGIIYNPKMNFIVSTGFSVLTKKQDKISMEFIYLWMTSPDILKKLSEIAALSVTTYPSISNDDLLDIEIPVPKNFDFSDINKTLRILFRTIDVNNKEIFLLQNNLSLISEELLQV